MQHEAAFCVVFRENPFGGGEVTLVCGLAQVVDLVCGFHFDENGIAYLALQAGLSLFPLNVRCSYTGLAAGRCIPRTRPLL